MKGRALFHAAGNYTCQPNQERERTADLHCRMETFGTTLGHGHLGGDT